MVHYYHTGLHQFFINFLRRWDFDGKHFLTIARESQRSVRHVHFRASAPGLNDPRPYALLP